MGAGYQYAHQEWYSKTGAAKKNSNKTYHGTYRGKGWSASDVMAEAMRRDGHCQHVPNPQKPTVLHGSSRAVGQAIDRWEKSQAVTVRVKGAIHKRALRSDAPRMVGGVISFPRERMDEWPAYRDQAVKMLKDEHGERLRFVVEHLDENHPHLHYYLVANPGEDFGVVHPGYAASRAARKVEGNHVGTAFKRAMRDWQDKIHEKLSAAFGLSRVGPKRERTDRQTRLLQIEQEKIDAKIAELEVREKKLVSQSGAIALQMATVAKLMTDLQRRENLLEKNKNDMHLEEEKRLARIAKLDQENEKTRRELADIFAKFDTMTKMAVQQQQPKIVQILKVEGVIASDLDNLGL